MRLALLLLPVGALAAQPGLTPPEVALRASGVFAGVFVDATDPTGATWCRGATWKARFDGDGVTVVPLFGSRAPRHHPLRFRVQGGRMGGVPLAAGPAPPTRVGTRRFEVDRGAARERWDLAPDHLELSFLVSEAPAPGDATVRVSIDSDLVVRRTEDGLLFAVADLGTVFIGDACAFDADGRRLPLAIGWEDGSMSLTVPAAWLATASYPVTIDPVVRPISLDTSAADTQFPDAAYDANHDEWLVVFQSAVAQTDFDVVSVRVSGAGDVLDTTFVDLSTANSEQATVAHNGGAGQFLVAWSERNGADTRIRGRTRSAGGTAQGATFDLVASGTNVTPALGGAATASADPYCLTYVRSTAVATGILLARTVSTTGVLGPEVVVEGTAMCDAAAPQITADCGAAGFWLVVWQDLPAFRCGGGQVMFAAVSRAGTLTQGPRRIENLGFQDNLPSVAGNGDQFLIVWERPVGSSGERDVMGGFVTRSGNAFQKVGATLALSANEPGVTPSGDQFAPSVAFDGCRYSYAYLENPGAQRPFAATLAVGPAGNATFHEGHVRLAAVSGTDRNLALAACGEAGGAPVRYLAVWDHQGLTATTRDVFGNLYDGMAPDGAARVVATACPSANAPVLAVGRAALGLPLTATVGNNVGATAVLVGRAVPPITLCASSRGTCRLGVDPLLVAARGFGAVVPCTPSLVGGHLTLQGIDLGSTLAGGCPSATLGVPLTVTDTIEVTFQ